MTRLALAVVVAAAGLTAAITHHPKRPVQVLSDGPAPEHDILRASRDYPRPPLPHKPRHRVPHRRRPVRPMTADALSDVTMYCATGNRNAAGRWPRLGDVAVLDRSIPFGTHVLIAGDVYTVEDWIGSGSQFDIYGGAGCEQRALQFGRKRLRVAVER